VKHNGESLLQPVRNGASGRVSLLSQLWLCHIVTSSPNSISCLCHERVEGRKESRETTRATLRLWRTGSRDLIRAGGLGHLLPGATLVHALGFPLASARRLDRFRLDPERPHLLTANAVRPRWELKERMSLLPLFVFPVGPDLRALQVRAGRDA